MTLKVENAVFMAKPSTEYVIMQKPCDWRTSKKLTFLFELKMQNKHKLYDGVITVYFS